MLYRISGAGYKAYLVGGSVRDLLLSRKPKDFDIGTDAHPSALRRLFRNCRMIGRRFRLAHILFADVGLPPDYAVTIETFYDRTRLVGQTLAKAETKIRKAHVQAIFTESSINPRLEDQIATEAGIAGAMSSVRWRARLTWLLRS